MPTRDVDDDADWIAVADKVASKHGGASPQHMHFVLPGPMINERASDWAGVKRGIDSCKELIRCASAGLKTPPVIILQSDQQEFGLFQKDADRIRASLVKGIKSALELADRCPKATAEYRAASQRAARPSWKTWIQVRIHISLEIFTAALP